MTIPKPTGVYVAPRDFKRGIAEIPECKVMEWAYKLFPVMNLAWTYVDTCLDIAAILRIGELKPVSRRIRELKRDYDIFRHPTVTDRLGQIETQLGEKFQEMFSNDFKLMTLNVDSEVAKLDLDPEYRSLVVAVHECLIIMETACEYCRRCENEMRREYHLTPPPHSLIQREFLEVMSLIPLYAGDCYKPNREMLVTYARTFANRLEKFQALIMQPTTKT